MTYCTNDLLRPLSTLPKDSRVFWELAASFSSNGISNIFYSFKELYIQKKSKYTVGFSQNLFNYLAHFKILVNTVTHQRYISRTMIYNFKHAVNTLYEQTLLIFFSTQSMGHTGTRKNGRSVLESPWSGFLGEYFGSATFNKNNLKMKTHSFI